MTFNDIVWRPWLPLLPWTGLTVLLLSVSLFSAARSWRTAGQRIVLLVLMRLAAILSLSVLLLGPSRQLPEKHSDERPDLTILLDTSQSMRTADCGAESRIAHAVKRALDSSLLSTLEPSYTIELNGFDTAVRPLRLDELRSRPDDFALGRETRLSDAVTQTAKRTAGDGSALVLVSDGRDTSDEGLQRAANEAASRRLPIFAIPIGGASSLPDATLMAMAMQESLLPDEPGELLVRAYQAGLAGQSALVRLQQGETLESFPVRFGDSDFTELRLPVRQKAAGQYEYVVALDRVGEESELGNNSQTVFVEVMNRRLRVLLLEGEPYWDSKFLAQSLRKDEQIELVQLTQIGDRKRETLVARGGGETTDLPETQEAWAQYDVVILGRSIETLLSEPAARSLVEFIQGGGHLVLARSRPYSDETDDGRRIARWLKPIEPVRWSDAPPASAPIQLTPSGRTGSWLSPSKLSVDPDDAFRRMPPLDELHVVESLAPAAVVVAESPAAQPAIVRMTVGRGSVLAILGAGTWRWSLLTPANENLRGFYDLFWSNLVRWLAFGGDFPPGQQASLSLSRRSVRLGDELTIDVAYRFVPDGAGPPQVRVTPPDAKTIDLTLERMPGPLPRYRANFTPSQAGVYSVRAVTPGVTPGELSSRFNVYDVNRERLNTAANPLALRMLADSTGGQVIEPGDVGRLPELLSRHRRSLKAPRQLEYLWDQAAVMWTILGWLCAEWFLRRWLGLW